MTRPSTGLDYCSVLHCVGDVCPGASHRLIDHERLLCEQRRLIVHSLGLLPHPRSVGRSWPPYGRVDTALTIRRHVMSPSLTIPVAVFEAVEGIWIPSGWSRSRHHSRLRCSGRLESIACCPYTHPRGPNGNRHRLKQCHVRDEPIARPSHVPIEKGGVASFRHPSVSRGGFEDFGGRPLPGRLSRG